MTQPMPEDIYQNFFSLSQDILCVAGVDGFFKEVNPMFYHTLGYDRDYLLSKKIVDLIHPEDIEKTQRELQKLQFGKNSIDFQNRYVDAMGQYHRFCWRAHHDLKTGLIYATARDVTERVALQDKFLQIKEALRQETIFVITDVDGVITEVNELFCEISGYSESELIGKTHKVVNSGLHPPSFFKELWTTISKGNIWAGPIMNRKKSGEIYYVQSIIIPIFSPLGHIDSYMAIRYDITEQVFSEAELNKILNILNETGSIAKVGGWELDAKTGELSWTDETFKILEVEQKHGRNPLLPEGLQLFTQEHKPIIDKAVSRCLEFGEPYELELQAKSPEGKIKWVFTNGKPNYINGELVSISGTIQDIHEKKLAELKFNRERQKSIQNAKFAALGELAASIAHEINNPLGIISAYAELMQQQVAESDEHNFNNKLATVLKSCHRISHIVQGLKRFSRTEQSSEYHQFSLHQIVNEAISLTQPRIKRELVQLTFQAGNSATIICNDIEIEQVVINLINNAIDAVKHLSSKWIDIQIVELESAYELRVTDSGLGIPDQVKIKMFEPFFTTKTANEGTGLGLAVIQEILTEHNATVRIDENCKNTCFVVTFQKGG